MMKQCLCLFSITLLVSCKPDIEQGSLPVIDIKKNINNFMFVNLSEIADNVEYVPLETDSNILLNDNIAIGVTDDRYITIGRLCTAFNKKGSFIGNYGSIGKGPGQFSLPDVMGIDRNNNKLYIKGSNFNILEYSLIDRTFIRSLNIEKLSAIEGMSNSIFYNCFGDNIFSNIILGCYKTRIVTFNDKLEVLNGYPNYFYNADYDQSFEYSYLNKPTFSIGNNILFKDGLCDTAYYLDKSLNRKPAYLFHLGNNKNPFEYLKSLQKKYEPDKGVFDFIQVDRFLENKDLLLFTCNFANQIPESEFFPINENEILKRGSSNRIIGHLNPINCIFNKKTSKLVFLKISYQYKKDDGGFSGFVNDIDGGVPFWSTNLYNNQLVMVVSAYDLKDYIRSDAFKNSKPRYPEKKEALQRLADSLNYDDNPVIMVVHLKDEE